MSIKYENVVPWGRSIDEYRRMFSLSDSDLSLNILGCGDGPASFNFEMKKSGYKVTSIDPIYQFTKEQIKNRIDDTYKIVLEQTSKNKDKFVWTSISSLDELGKIRMESMKKFLDDYNLGKIEKRYLHEELPNLSFGDKQFDLALSSHFLFLYSDNLSYEFHIEAVLEMLRVAVEVRIFPIIDTNGNRSIHLDKIIDCLKNMNYTVEEIAVDYEFQKGGNKMLKIR